MDYTYDISMFKETFESEFGITLSSILKPIASRTPSKTTE